MTMDAYQRAYWAANKVRLTAYRKKWAQDHPTNVRAIRLRVRERQRVLARAWYERNRARILAKRRDLAGHYNRLARERRAAGSDAVRAQDHRHAMQRRNVAGSHTAQEWREKCALFANLCAYCGEAKPLTRDHKIPLIRGGTDDICNIVPACAGCNRKKSTQTDREFLSATA